MRLSSYSCPLCVYFIETGWALIVMPRWRSSAMSSSSCSFMSRRLTVPVNSSNRSASVLLPWSMWATIEKLRMYFGSGMEEGYGRQDAGDREFYGRQQASLAMPGEFRFGSGIWPLGGIAQITGNRPPWLDEVRFAGPGGTRRYRAV